MSALLSLYSDRYVRFCQWKNVELNINVSGLNMWYMSELIIMCIACVINLPKLSTCKTLRVLWNV